jgi:thiosulfate/3-mercaptopyruvate sulfurtransferase
MNTSFGPIISAQALHALMANPSHSGPDSRLVVIDCSFDLGKPEVGRAQHLQVRIPGALYADLDRDLSQKEPAPGLAASGGRHPLPMREQFATTLGQWGVTPDTRVVVYDRNGNMVGGRLWWMLKWCGHANVAVLDGGLGAWAAAGYANESGPAPEPQPAADYPLEAPLVALVSAAQVFEKLGHNDQTLIDARATPRFKGEVEPLDPAAGHIPGALNRPFSDNFDANGLYHSPQTLRQTFDQLLGSRAPESVVLHCGSGVSAIPNLIAMTLAGYPTPALFAGSWSEWCSDATRPVAKG